MDFLDALQWYPDMAKSPDINHVIAKRAIIVAVLQCVLVMILIGRMGYLQLFQSEHYKTLADGNRIRLGLTISQRGKIIDRFGTEIAVNKKNFRVVLIPEETDDIVSSLQILETHIELPESVIDVSLKKARSLPKFTPIVIKDNLTWDEVSILAVHDFDLPGIHLEEGASRFYPLREDLAHVLGYVQVPNAEEAKKTPLGKKVDYRIGKTGIERWFDDRLQGVPGSREEEVNAYGRVVRTLSQNPPSPGATIQLTLDAELQKTVYARLQHVKSASAIVMDVRTGEVLALASSPGFDPNLFVGGIGHQDWQTILNNPYNMLMNKAVTGEYSPGSIFKTVVGLSALENGIITPETKIHCAGHYMVGNHKFHCWKPYGHGAVNLEDALMGSCDVYFYDVSQKLGIEKIGETARKLGLGVPTGIEIPHEKSGLVPSKEWKKKRFGYSWTVGETINAGIGQGYFLTTPLQLVTLVAQFANGGYWVRPRLTFGNSAGQSLDFKPEHIEAIKKGLFKVVNNPQGTGFRSRLDDPAWQMAGKTSSSQVRRITMQDRKMGLRNLKRQWADKEHAMFSCFVPVHDPKYAITVVVEHGEWGGSVAAPIGKDIAEFLKSRDRQYTHKDPENV
jgi:penicillin-binding protein 2